MTQTQSWESAGFIGIDPPLPCVDPVAGPLFITGLGPARVRLRIPGGHRADQGSHGCTEGRALTLTIAAGEGRIYTIQVTPKPSQAGDAAHAAAAGSQHDLGPDELVAVPDSHSADVVHEILTIIRKDQHITLCAGQDVEASDRYTGFGDITLLPDALPDLCADDLDTARIFLGTRFRLPLLITGMTGGLERGQEINRRLARAAAAFGIPMGVGSQRVALENPQHAAIFRVKNTSPDVFLIGNIGMAQLLRPDAADLCRRAVDMISADALAIHLNVLQEMVQVEGDRDFRRVTDRIAAITRILPVPVMVKEIGSGIDPRSARALIEAGVRAIDCGGRGGTSWSHIEGLRASSPVTRRIGATFRDWGIPTAAAVRLLAGVTRGHADLVATGGIRNGLDAAKAVAVGAGMCGIGLPLLRAALEGETALHDQLAAFAAELRIAMMLCGAPTLDALRGRAMIAGQLQVWQAAYSAGEGVSCGADTGHDLIAGTLRKDGTGQGTPRSTFDPAH